jgi:hypothetical protein
MATIFNTKIRLRYDSYDAWHAANPILDAGEVAIVRPATQVKDADHVANCLMKVGDGKSHFDDLAWLSAKAADVHTWAKKSESEFKTWLTSEEGAHLATAADLATLSTKIVAVEGNIKTLQDDVKTLKEDTSVAALTGRVETLEGEMDAAQAAIGTNDNKGSLFSRMAKAEGDIIANGNAITANGSAITTINGKIDKLNGDVSTEGSVAHAVKAEETRATGVEANLQKAIDDEVTNRKAAIAQEVTDRDTAITTAIGTVNSELAGVKTTADDAQKRVGVVEGVLNGTEGATGLVAKVNTLIGDDAGKTARAIAAEEIDVLIKGSDPEGGKTIENIANLVKYVDENAGDIAELVSTVGGHTTKIGTLESEYSTLNGTVEGHTTEIGNIKSSIGENTTGKTLIQLIADNSTADQAKAKELADQALADAKAHTNQAIENVNSAATTLAGRVKANEDKLAGIDTTVTAAIATAKQEAIDDAATDAASKVAVALAEAQSDATTKANNALADAKTYTDTAISPVAAGLSTLNSKAITGALDENNNLTMTLNSKTLDIVFVCGGAQ